MTWSRRVVVRALLVSVWALSLFTLAYPARAQAQGDGGGTHVVTRGETLSQIARDYGTDVTTLLALNDLRNANLVYVGQQLVVPSGGGNDRGIDSGSGWDQPSQNREEPQRNAPATQRQGVGWEPPSTNGDGPYQYAGVGWEPEAAQNAPERGRASWESQPAAQSSYAEDAAWEPQAAPRQPYLQEWESVHAGSGAYSPGTSWEPPTSTVETSRGPEYSGEKWIDIDIGDQVLIAYQGDDPVRYFTISSGSANYPTVTGSFRTYSRTEMQDMSGGSHADGTYYFQPDVPWVQYFFEGYAIHGAYWHNSFGSPIGHGCINMRVEESRWLYEWTGKTGTRVEVHP